MTEVIRPRQDLTVANLGRMMLYAMNKGIDSFVFVITVNGKSVVVIRPSTGTCEDWINAVCTDPLSWWRPAHFKIMEIEE